MDANAAEQQSWMRTAGFTLVDRSPRDETALYQGHKLSVHVPIDSTDPEVLMAHVINGAAASALEDLRLRARKLASDLGLALKPI